MRKKDLGIRPICINDSCNKETQFMGTYDREGNARFRPFCSSCHCRNIKNKNNGKDMQLIFAEKAGYLTVEEYKNALKIRKKLAKQLGFNNVTEYDCYIARKDILEIHDPEEYRLWNSEIKLKVESGEISFIQYQNSWHPYRKYRLDYCENIDGRLGYKCTTTITYIDLLDVDHKDGNPSNNNPINLQTLCACCHRHKTIESEDRKSPGRKALGIKY